MDILKVIIDKNAKNSLNVSYKLYIIVYNDKQAFESAKAKAYMPEVLKKRRRCL
ncbi:MAG: hypothetical protein IJV46_02880 [Acidaminococcaceae bacterium]|nr:hypothetical protein [Acidaminococcaceae bacterium]